MSDKVGAPFGSVTFFNGDRDLKKNTWDDWSLVLQHVDVGVQEPQITTVDLPYADGFIDLSESARGMTTFDAGMLTLSLAYFGREEEKWNNIFCDLMDSVHGKIMESIKWDLDPENETYSGYCIVTSVIQEKNRKVITIECHVHALTSLYIGDLTEEDEDEGFWVLINDPKESEEEKEGEEDEKKERILYCVRYVRASTVRLAFVTKEEDKELIQDSNNTEDKSNKENEGEEEVKENEPYNILIEKERCFPVIKKLCAIVASYDVMPPESKNVIVDLPGYGHSMDISAIVYEEQGREQFYGAQVVTMRLGLRNEMNRLTMFANTQDNQDAETKNENFAESMFEVGDVLAWMRKYVHGQNVTLTLPKDTPDEEEKDENEDFEVLTKDPKESETELAKRTLSGRAAMTTISYVPGMSWIDLEIECQPELSWLQDR